MQNSFVAKVSCKGDVSLIPSPVYVRKIFFTIVNTMLAFVNIEVKLAFELKKNSENRAQNDGKLHVFLADVYYIFQNLS